MEAILSISRRKLPSNKEGRECFREATSPYQSPFPFPRWKAFKPLCCNPDCQELLSCHCCAVTEGRTKVPLHLESADAQFVGLFLERSGQIRQPSQYDIFFGVKQDKVVLLTHCLVPDYPDLDYLGRRACEQHSCLCLCQLSLPCQWSVPVKLNSLGLSLGKMKLCCNYPEDSVSKSRP